MQEKVLFVRSTANKKTGPIPVVYSSRDTCPKSCSWYDKGCYAKTGPTYLAWKKVENGISWEELYVEIKKFPRNTIWRYAVAGDLPGTDYNIDLNKLNKLVKANKGKCGFAYTHKPVGKSKQALINATAIRAANINGFVINLSCDSLAEADTKYDLKIGPVVVVLPEDSPLYLKTPKGRQIVVCPAETKGKTCDTCKACAKADRKVIIGFRAHGVEKKFVNNKLKVIA